MATALQFLCIFIIHNEKLIIFLVEHVFMMLLYIIQEFIFSGYVIMIFDCYKGGYLLF